ncbi:MAG: ABC transporter permease [Defluviitaleaceae bacterium]|nr:ABC transporter permease [Defluviitaleaceae bacterium]
MKKMIASFLHKLLFAIFAVIILIATWHLIVVFGGFNHALFPPPLVVFATLRDMISSGEIFVHIRISLWRFFVGYSLAVFVGLVLGLIVGRVNFLSKLVEPLIQLIRPVAPVAWLPFIVLLFGIGDMPAIMVIFIAAFYPVLMSTITGSKKVDKRYMDVAKMFEIKQPQVFLKIILPAIFPYIANGMHMGLGTAWVFLVAGEMMGVRSGLGFLIMDSRNNMQPEVLLATICVIALLGLSLDKIITLFESRVNKHWGIGEGE